MRQQSGGSHRRQSGPHDQAGSYEPGPHGSSYRGGPDAYRVQQPYQQQQQQRDGYYQQPGAYQQQPDSRYRQQDYYRHDGYAPAPPPRKKRRVFLWVFFAVQTLFLIWLIGGLATGNHSNATDLAQACNGHNWYPLFKSQADCHLHYNVALNDAQNVGKGLGIAFIVVFWIIVDFFLGLGYGIYRLATRGR
jgi:hypothetical protein